MARLHQTSVGPAALEMKDVKYDAMDPGVAHLCFVTLRFACALAPADQLTVGRSW